MSHQSPNRCCDDSRFPLISATGSTAMGRRVAEVVGARLGRTLLELGGNNGLIVMPDADLAMVLRATLFGAVGTAGQRCTSIRRLFLNKSIAPGFTDKLISAWKQVRIGAPLAPRHSDGSPYQHGCSGANAGRTQRICEQGGEVLYGGNALGGCFVEPCIVRARPDMPILREEIFAPILYLIEFDELGEAIAWHNDVPQGLSSAIFTRDMQSAETFLSAVRE